MRQIESTHEHRGISFTTTDKMINDAVEYYGLDVLHLVEQTIDNFLTMSAIQGLTKEFKVILKIEKEVTPMEIIHHFRVIRVDPSQRSPVYDSS
jgi:hypothetical protein